MEHGEAAADVITGGVIARAVEPDAGTAQGHGEHGKCRNCGSALTGAYCSNCGQPAHLHRSLSSLGHDILHGVFHFEGKVWHTIPELLFHPGRLTRRYIDGERAKFVSPMALYLFTVFMMFAVFSFTSGKWFTIPEGVDFNPATQWKRNIAMQMAGVDEKIAALDERLAEDDLAPAQRAELQKEIADEKAAREVMTAMVSGDWAKLAALGTQAPAADSPINTKVGAALDEKLASVEAQLTDANLSESKRARLQKELADLKTGREAIHAVVSGDWAKMAEIERRQSAAAPEGKQTTISNTRVQTGWPTVDARLSAAIQEASDNPELMLYKLKIAGYKYSWALIPLSVPFMWLLFFWRRDIHLYDHAIFVTYSISFMMMFLALWSISGMLDVSSAIRGPALAFIPPLHLYKQLRGAHGLSRIGALGRLFLLSILISIVVTLFAILLVTMGLLG